MLRFFASNFYVFGIIFLAFNVAVSLLLIWIAEYSALAPVLQKCRGVVGPYFTSVSVLFGLYSAFLANDIWATRDKAVAAVSEEGESIRLALRAAEAMGEHGKALDALLHQYERVSVEEEWPQVLAGRQTAVAAPQIRAMLHEAMSGNVAEAGPQAQRVAIEAIADLRHARRERISIALTRDPEEKVLAVFIFGFLTQIALVAVHLGKPGAAVLTGAIFAAAMTVSMMVIVADTNPYDGRIPITLQDISDAFSSASGR